MNEPLATSCVEANRRSLPSRTMLAALLISAALFNSIAVAATCLPLDLPSALQFNGGDSSIAIYEAPTPQIGGAGVDYFHAIFFDEAIGVTGIFQLGSGANANYSTCTHCLDICADINPITNECGKDFFADQGTLELLTAPGAEILQFNVKNWHFAQVTIDDRGISTPVPGGDCYIERGAAIFSSGFEAQ